MTTNALSLFRLLLRERPSLLRHLQGLVGHEGAEDVAQALWLKIHAVHDHPPIANKKAFLYRMARNVAIDMVRSDKRRSRHITSGDELPGDIAAPVPSAETAMLDREALVRLTAALAELSPRCQQIIRMNRIDGVSITDIAARLGISRQMVGRYIAQGMAHCCERLDDENWKGRVSEVLPQTSDGVGMRRGQDALEPDDDERA
ncbi:RNA polymerase sigma factor [Novosphingobium aerophilum]|uniref:RNA polymerase sigma factor n=1 Tax=Novosphingobium TaxID=165696 RepID=UPI00163D8CC0|nr:RNA polymerase sigma factor [Novosphingobium sp. RL4]WRT95830.1 RNA polymerase sigma factor [Novosphingobium sp. RL4]